jgi:hypothetical protein
MNCELSDNDVTNYCDCGELNNPFEKVHAFYI